MTFNISHGLITREDADILNRSAIWSDSTGTALVNPSGGTVPLQRGRPLSVSAIGDSITVRNMGNLDLNGNTAAQTYAQTLRCYSGSSWLALGAARSQYAWFPHEYLIGQSGATSAQVLSAVLPAYLANPFGLADAVVVLAGTNDIGASVPVATTIANLKLIYNALMAAGITPIAATVPPRADSPGPCEQLNWAIVRLAQEYRLPLADFYSALVHPSNGGFAQTTYYDGSSVLHPSQVGANIMGYVLNRTITGWWGAQPNLITATYDNSAITTQNRDPHFLSVTGSVNSSSSYPNVGWGAPSTITLSTVFNSAGTEPGTGHTMYQPTPNIAGITSTPNYLGQAWSLVGDNTNAPIAQYNGAVSYTKGDKIALSFRCKAIPGAVAPAHYMDFFVGLANQANGAGLCGLMNNYSYGWANNAPQIGSETNYPAGDFYFEYTVNSTPLGLRGVYQLASNGGNVSNTNDNITIADFRVINLTAAGIVTP